MLFECVLCILIVIFFFFINKSGKTLKMMRRIVKQVAPVATSSSRRFTSSKPTIEEPLDTIVKNEVVPALSRLTVNSSIPSKLMVAFSIVGMIGCWSTVYVNVLLFMCCVLHHSVTINIKKPASKPSTTLTAIRTTEWKMMRMRMKTSKCLVKVINYHCGRFQIAQRRTILRFEIYKFVLSYLFTCPSPIGRFHFVKLKTRVLHSFSCYESKIVFGRKKIFFKIFF